MVEVVVVVAVVVVIVVISLIYFIDLFNATPHSSALDSASPSLSLCAVITTHFRPFFCLLLIH